MGTQWASNTNKDKGKDWRVSLSVPPNSREYMAGGSLLDPLIKTDMKLGFSIYSNGISRTQCKL